MNEGLDREGIVLHGNGEFLLPGADIDILVFHQLILLDDLPCIAQKLLAVGRDHDPTVRTQKDLDPDLLFQFLDGRRKGRLCDVETLRGLVHGAAVRDGDHLSKLL